MLMITNLRDGAVLNRHYGTETEEYLEVPVEGIAEPQAHVTVNGQEAERFDRRFCAKVRLTRKINRITAVAEDTFGEFQQTITVVWDKKSTRRYAFFFDDCSFFLRSIALNRPKSLFDEMFLGRLKKIHERYGTKFTLNLFYHDDHHDFCIHDFPTDYKAEFQANSDWLKMAFHAKSEFPDRPYQSADAKKLADDFDLIKSEVCRFAGEDSFIAPLVIHWAMTNPENFKVLHERGVRCLTGGFMDTIAYIGEKHTVRTTDIGYHYEQDTTHYITKTRAYYDKRYDMFLSKSFLCCNYSDIPEIQQEFAKLLAGNPIDTICLMSHEQYTYSDYFNYIPNHLDRVEEACRQAELAGYKPAYFSYGLLGNMAWEEK